LPDIKISPSSIVIGLAGTLVLGIFGWLSFGPKPAPAPPPKLTAEARAYLSSLGLTNVRMQAAESYVNQRVVEILGDISNKGDRTLKTVEVTCVFRDFGNRELLRERALVVGNRGGSMAKGETRSFRLAFDDVPNTWNQAMPTLVIAQIQFE
jgi:hypothetical protein